MQLSWSGGSFRDGPCAVAPPSCRVSTAVVVSGKGGTRSTAMSRVLLFETAVLVLPLLPVVSPLLLRMCGWSDTSTRPSFPDSTHVPNLRMGRQVQAVCPTTASRHALFHIARRNNMAATMPIRTERICPEFNKPPYPLVALCVVSYILGINQSST